MKQADKTVAGEFLATYEKHLKDAVRAPAAVGFEDVGPLARVSEAGFVLGWALPVLHQLLQKEGLDEEETRIALLAEASRPRGKLTRGTPARRPLSPFSKDMGITAAAQYERCCRPQAMTQACPDYALREPFPHRIVFETKYLKGNVGAARAQRDLVQTIYEANYYRGLPAVPAGKTRPAYDYDYGCLVALDGTRDGMLRAAWKALRPEVRRGFREGANLYVMALRVES